jgi:apolipoprotein N-acyltransferase
VLACWLYGVVRLATLTVEEGPRVAIIQPNLVHDYQEKAYEIHQAQYQQSLEDVPRGAADLVAWPENAILERVDEEGTLYLGELRELAANLDASLFVGGYGWDENAQEVTNGVWYIHRTGELGGRYDKRILAPFTEYLPLEWFFRPVETLHQGYLRLVNSVLGYLPAGTRGRGANVFELRTAEGAYRFGTMICGENVVPWVSRQAAAEGAQFLFNPTSEGFFGRHAYYVTWGSCVLRAVENRVGVVRVGNNGISGFIGPDGQGYGEVRDERGRLWVTSGTSIERVRISESRGTFFTRYGGAVGALFPLLTALLVAWPALAARIDRLRGSAPARSSR